MEQKEQKKEETPAAEELQKNLKEANEKLLKYQEVMDNPEVKQAMTLIAQGQKIGPVDQAKKPEKSDQPKSMKALLGKDSRSNESVNLDDMSNVELVDVLAEVIDTVIGEAKETAGGKYEDILKDLNLKIDKTQEFLIRMNAEREVSNIATKYPDFDKYRGEMQDKAKQYPNMAVEDIYKLVKADHILKGPNPEETYSEKPESSGVYPQWQPVEYRDKETGEKSESKPLQTTPIRGGGRRNFLQLVEKAASRRRQG
jgi:hypothetical protein